MLVFFSCWHPFVQLCILFYFCFFITSCHLSANFLDYLCSDFLAVGTLRNIIGCPPVLQFGIDLSLELYSFLLANHVNSFSSSLDNWSLFFLARHSCMVADLNVQRLHEVVELYSHI